jgi:hypothetical protein
MHNRPQPDAEFLIIARISQGHSLLRHFSKLNTLPNNCAPNTGRRRRVVSRNVVLNLVKVLLGQPGE